MQPMMFVSSGDELPETIGVLLLRSAWRYRSELTPLYLAALIFGGSLWLHVARPHWWAFIVTIAAVATSVLAAFGKRMGIPSLIERLYVSTTTLAIGG